MRLLRWLENVIWPRGTGCLCCGEFSEGEFLCPTCHKALKAMRLQGEDAGGETIRSIYRYDGAAKQLVRLLKEECMEDAAYVLAEEMAAEITHMELPADTVLTWVTMPELRRRKRGIDHGRVLCEAVAAKAGMPVRCILTRKGNMHTQRGLSRVDRMKNITGSLQCEGNLDMPVLIIDDVLTTGATISACGEALCRAGATKVFALTATRALLRRR